MRLSCVLVALLAGCSFDGSGPSATASVDGGDSGDCHARCDDFERVTCEDDAEVREICEADCDDAGGVPVCLSMQPSNGLSATAFADVTGEIVVPDGESWVIEVDTGRILDDDGMPRRSGESGVSEGIRYTKGLALYAFAINRLEVGVGSTLTLVNTAPLMNPSNLPVALYVLGDVVVHGVVSVAAIACDTGPDVPCPGPGGGRGATMADPAGGCGPGGDDAPGGNDNGGGGGAFGAAGAEGGGDGVDPGGTAGIICTTDDSLEPLVGGSGGGVGSNNTAGGGAGGALQVSSHASIEISCAMDADACGFTAGGSGGGGGDLGKGGGGGGSGGAILLEAPLVTIDGAGLVAANGGGGGEGNGNGSGKGTNASLAIVAAAGGVNPPSSGGNGGFLESGAQDGSDSVNGGGGAGASVGKIRINTRAGDPVGTTTPAASIGTIAAAPAE